MFPTRRYDYNTDVESSDVIRESRSPRYYGDTDLSGIFPILVAGCIMLTPILNWSTMIRKHHAQPVVLYWGIIMFFALIFTLPPSAEGVQPYFIRKLATCFKDKSLGCTYEDVIDGDGFSVISLDFYNKCVVILKTAAHSSLTAGIGVSAMTHVARFLYLMPLFGGTRIFKPSC